MKPLGIVVCVAIAALGGAVIARHVHADCTPWLDWFKVCAAVMTN